MTKNRRDRICGFCNKSYREVGPLFEYNGACICHTCVTEAQKVLESKITEMRFAGFRMPHPVELVDELDKFIVGQSEAKKAVAVAVVNHYHRILLNNSPIDDDLSDVEVDKSNICLIGPTGVGKTLLAQTLAKKLQVPFAIGDATTLTEAGYVGEDVENLLLRLIQAADGDIQAAQCGIIYIDEVDKIARTSDNRSITRDVSGEGVQQSLLKMLEGTTANVPPHGGRKHPEQSYIPIETRNILFIVGGTFVGIDQIIGKRIGRKQMGFGACAATSDEQNKKEIMSQVIPEDLVKFGMIPEFVGRLPIITVLDDLNTDAMVSILTQPKNALVKQYRKLARARGVDLTFTEDSLQEIAKEAILLKTGARGLRSVCERFMQDFFFGLANDCKGDFQVTTDVVRGETSVFDCKKREAA